MNQDLLKSIIFHLIIAILLVMSTWSFFSRHEKPLDERPIVVSLAPIGEKTNLKPAPHREVKPPQPKKPPAPKPEPKKPAPKPEPKKPEPKKPEPKKPDKKPEKKPDKPKPDELDQMLKDLDKTKTDDKSSNEKDTKEDSKSDKPFDANSPEAIAEEDYIKKLITDQVKICWSPPAGVRDAKDLIVRVEVDIAPDGTMKFVGFEGGDNSNPIYQAASDSARRAVLDPDCNPLKELPPANKYSIWKEMTLIFDPKDLIY